MSSLINREHEAILNTYKRLPIECDYAEGCYIYDNEGNEYLDFLSGIAVNLLGNRHPAVIDAIAEQINKFLHVSNYFYQAPQVELAESLLKYFGQAGRVFFSNSGAEANEGAMKIARLFGNINGKSKIVAFSGGFHGRTYGVLSIMDKPNYKEGMSPYLPDTEILEYNSIDDLQKINEDTAAVFLEFLQGEGGIRAANPEWIEELESLRKKYGFLMVADEIQSGCGRTGSFFAWEHFCILPDIVTLAKGLGGGLPLGAIMVSEDIATLLRPGLHGTTFGGNPVACAAGQAIINELESGAMDNAALMGGFLRDLLIELQDKHKDKILEIRGMGLMLGIQLSFDPASIISNLLERQVLVNTASDNVLRILPPLIIGTKHIERFITALDQALSK